MCTCKTHLLAILGGNLTEKNTPLSQGIRKGDS